MDWLALLGLPVVSVVLTLVAQAVGRGWREAATARGRRDSLIDRLLRSRLVWMTDNHRLRQIAYDHGATAEEVGELPDDPYTDDT